MLLVYAAVVSVCCELSSRVDRSRSTSF